MKLSNIIKQIKVATQEEVNIGTSVEGTVTPLTLNGWSSLVKLSGDKKIILKQDMDKAEIGCLVTENGQVLGAKLDNAKTYSPVASTEFDNTNIAESSSAFIYGNYFATVYRNINTTIGKIIIGLLDETTGSISYGTAIEFTTDLCTETTSGRNLKLITTSSGYPVIMYRESDKRGIVKSFSYSGLLLTLKDTDSIYYTNAIQYLDISSTDVSNNFIITYHQSNTWKHTIQTATIGTGTKIYLSPSDAKTICYCKTPKSVALSSSGSRGYLFYNVDTDDGDKLKIRCGKLDDEDITTNSTILTVDATVNHLEAIGFDRNDARGLLIYDNIDDNKTYMKLSSFNNSLSSVSSEVIISDIVTNRHLSVVDATTVILGFEQNQHGKLIKIKLSSGMSYGEVSSVYTQIQNININSYSLVALTEDQVICVYGNVEGYFVSVINGLSPDHLLMSTAEAGVKGELIKVILPFYKNNTFTYDKSKIGTKVTTMLNGKDITIGIVTDVNEIIITKTSLNAIGEISDINNLTNELNARALTVHTHSFNNISNMPTQPLIAKLTSTDDISLKINEIITSLEKYGVIN